MLEGILALPFEQPVSASEPAGRGGGLSSKQHVVTDPERAAHGRQSLAVVQVSMMGALESADVVVIAAKHVGRPRQQLEVRRSERLRLVGARERLESLDPRPGRK